MIPTRRIVLFPFRCEIVRCLCFPFPRLHFGRQRFRIWSSGNKKLLVFFKVRLKKYHLAEFRLGKIRFYTKNNREDPRLGHCYCPTSYFLSILLWNNTYDGNLCVISEHQTIKPSVIIMADKTVNAQEIIPKKTSRNSPRNVGSSLFIASREIL